MDWRFDPYNYIGWHNRMVLKPEEVEQKHQLLVNSFSTAKDYDLLHYNDGRFVNLWLMPKQNCGLLAA